MALNPTTPTGQLGYEPVTGDQDSLTQFVRSEQNLTGSAGAGAFNAGTNTFQSGVSDLQPSVDYFKRLLGGDRSEILSALGPETDTITSQFDQIRKMAAQGPRGGGSASTLVQAPQEETKQISNLISQARTGAATNLASTAGAEAGLGLSEQGVGLQGLLGSLQAALNRRGQNIQENANTMQLIGDLGKGIGSLIGGLIARGGSSGG